LKYIKEFNLPFPIIHDPFHLAEDFIKSIEKNCETLHIHLKTATKQEIEQGI